MGDKLSKAIIPVRNSSCDQNLTTGCVTQQVPHHATASLLYLGQGLALFKPSRAGFAGFLKLTKGWPNPLLQDTLCVVI